MRFFLFFLTTASLTFAQSNGAVAVGSNGSLPLLYSIDLSQRGYDLVQTFDTLKNPNSVSTGIAFQTTQRLLFNVNSILTTPNYTILFVGTTVTGSKTDYTVVFTDQILQLVYYPSPPGTGFNASKSYTSTPIGGVIPYYSVDLTKRAADIISAISTLVNNQLPANPPTNRVAVQTSLQGSYAPGFLDQTPGLIRDVRSASLIANTNNTLMQINYRVNLTIYSVIVTPDQVMGITYTQN